MPRPDDRERVAADICARLAKAGHRALLAGGCVRDRVLGRPPQDYDIATSAPVDEIPRLFERTVPVGLAFGVVLVVVDETPYEVATFRRDGRYLDGRRPESVAPGDERSDAARRDFTVNALFMDPVSGEILDYVDGLSDLRAGVIRTVGDPGCRFAEDRLRLLRAVRFAAQLGFRIEEETLSALRRMAPRIHDGVSAERVRGEVLRMLTGGAAGRALRLLDETGLLAEILPEVAALRGVEQPPAFHPEGDVFTHTALMLDRLPADCPPVLAMAALLHDIGKPATQTFEDRIRFHFHEKEGAATAEAVCRRLRMSADETRRIVWLVAQHMRVAALPDMREGRRRLFVAEPDFALLLHLAELDCTASHGDMTRVAWTRDYLAGLADGVQPPPCPVTGDDLIRLGMRPGPLFREILDELREGFLEGRYASREEALARVAERHGGDASR